MFAIQCPNHGTEVLVTERRIRRMENTPGGIVMDVECYCGTHVVVRTGRRLRAASVDANDWVAPPLPV
jgi:hypothetical protein